jgi:hypothetical protein
MAAREKLISKRDLIPEEEDTKCADDLWDYIEAHEASCFIVSSFWKLYTRKRGLKSLI